MPTQTRPKLVNLTLRDGQQSTLAQEEWVFDPADLSKVISAAKAAGFSGAEIAGGQSFQIAINCGYNPFTILNAVSHALAHGKVQDFSLQMLFRGANALGFRHYDRDLIEKTLAEFIKCGINKIRCFDALNDIDNLKLPESIRQAQSSSLTLEGAICFTHYADYTERYTDQYFVNYAKALLNEGYSAIAIKDMSGQLTAKRISTLVPALLEVLAPNNIPLTLHVHSTHAEHSKGAIQEALNYAIDTIETVDGSLAGGSAHHSLATISEELIDDSAAYARLEKVITNVWTKNPDRKDQQIPENLKQQLCAAGVPGGAMPFVIRDLSQQQSTIRAKYLASQHVKEDSLEVENPENFEAIIDLFIAELKQVCLDANLPLLVTPTADICCKQAIANLAFGNDPYSNTLAGRYLNNSGQPNPDSRYAKLILGYYGALKSYEEGNARHTPSAEVITFFESHNASQLKTITGCAADNTTGDDLRESQQQAWRLVQKLGAGALSFASFDQLTILYALKPFSALASEDPIFNAVQTYLSRSESAKIDGRGSTFPGYEFLMQPLLCYMRSMFIFEKNMDAQQIVRMPLSVLGENLCSQLYDIYVDLSLWKNVTDLSNHLSKLFSSSHISHDLMQAAHYVSDSLSQLDLRPDKYERNHIDAALERFKSLTIAELFSSLALINSFVIDVAKHATNPTLYAVRSLSMKDIHRFVIEQEMVNASASIWEQHVSQSLVSKRIRLESDLQKRLEDWRK